MFKETNSLIEFNVQIRSEQVCGLDLTGLEVSNASFGGLWVFFGPLPS